MSLNLDISVKKLELEVCSHSSLTFHSSLVTLPSSLFTLHPSPLTLHPSPLTPHPHSSPPTLTLHSSTTILVFRLNPVSHWVSLLRAHTYYTAICAGDIYLHTYYLPPTYLCKTALPNDVVGSMLWLPVCSDSAYAYSYSSACLPTYLPT